MGGVSDKFNSAPDPISGLANGGFDSRATEIFDALRDLATSQGILDIESVQTGDPVGFTGELIYKFLGRQVCRKCFAKLFSVGWQPRLQKIYDAVSRGVRHCPLDARYMQCAVKHVPSALRGEVYSYLESLYESVAETLPDSDSGASANSDSGSDCQLFDLPDPPASGAKREVRKLPPGTMYETWRQFLELGGKGGFKLFWSTWRDDWPMLKFRRVRSHAVCSTCVKHKLLIRSLSGDLNQRLKQRHLFDLHLKNQYRDRQRYWSLRTASRTLTSSIICLTIDAMDQSKYAWPRSYLLDAKEFESFVRPRSHVYGTLVHGFFSMLTVSHADACRGSSFTADLLAHIFTVLSKHVDLREKEVHILLDNAAGSNKNNTIFALCGLMVILGAVKSIRVLFLRVGHTHEDRCLPTQLS